MTAREPGLSKPIERAVDSYVPSDDPPTMFTGARIPPELHDKLNEMMGPIEEPVDRPKLMGMALAVALYAGTLEQRIAQLEEKNQ